MPLTQYDLLAIEAIMDRKNKELEKRMESSLNLKFSEIESSITMVNTAAAETKAEVGRLKRRLTRLEKETNRRSMMAYDLHAHEQMHLIVEEALSNSTILRHIFSFLNEEDLERCCHVSKFWRKVADPLVFSHFEIHLGKRVYQDLDPEYDVDDREEYNNYYELSDEDRSDSDHIEIRNHTKVNELGENEWESDNIVVIERARYNRKIFTRNELNFWEVTKKLPKVLNVHKVSITLRIRARTDDQKMCMEHFLSKFGPQVVDISFDEESLEAVTLPLNVFYKLLLNSLPNLRNLNFAKLRLEEDSTADRNFNPDLPHNKHKHLKKISYAPFAVQSFVTFLKFAPNMDEIQRLPFKLVTALDVAQKSQALKSLENHFMRSRVSREDDEMFLGYFQTLARLQPKLTSFQLIENPYPIESGSFFDKIKALIFSVLESSTETLQTLRLPSTGWRGYQNLPCLEALKRLEFSMCRLDDTYYGFMFPTNILLTQVFPNVREIHLSDCELDKVMDRLPENLTVPWGSQIKFLRVQYLTVKNVLLLQIRFPALEEIQFMGTSNEIAELLPALALWSNLKSLKIGIQTGWYRIPAIWKHLKADCAFTGLSEEVVEQLLDSSTRGNFSDSEIQGFKAESPMNKFKELRNLTLVFMIEFSDRRDVQLVKLTPVANEFGFKLLPRLKVTLGLWHTNERVEYITKALEPLAQSDNIEIDHYYDDGKWTNTTVYDPQDQ